MEVSSRINLYQKPVNCDIYIYRELYSMWRRYDQPHHSQKSSTPGDTWHWSSRSLAGHQTWPAGHQTFEFNLLLDCLQVSEYISWNSKLIPIETEKQLYSWSLWVLKTLFRIYHFIDNDLCVGESGFMCFFSMFGIIYRYNMIYIVLVLVLDLRCELFRVQL